MPPKICTLLLLMSFAITFACSQGDPAKIKKIQDMLSNVRLLRLTSTDGKAYETGWIDLCGDNQYFSSPSRIYGYAIVPPNVRLPISSPEQHETLLATGQFPGQSAKVEYEPVEGIVYTPTVEKAKPDVWSIVDRGGELQMSLLVSGETTRYYTIELKDDLIYLNEEPFKILRLSEVPYTPCGNK